MHPLLQNKYVRGAGIILATLVAFLIIFAFLTASLNTARDNGGLSFNTKSGGLDMSESYAPIMDTAYEMESSVRHTSYPTPTPQGYTSGLETYETTSYRITANTKSFDSVCEELAVLKADPAIHFKNLNTSLNSCSATFYAEEARAAGVLVTFEQYKDVKVDGQTISVTRHKQNLESQTNILQQQLARTESSLRAAQAQLDRLNAQFASSDDVTGLSAEVTRSLQYIDQLTERKIGYTSRLDSLYQQAADLNERLDVVEFSVSVSRFNPIRPNETARQWQNAWDDLTDTFTETLIALSALFAIYLLWVLRAIVYLLVALIVLRGLWKFVKLLWSRW